MIESVTIDSYALHSTPASTIGLRRFDGLGSPSPRDNRPGRAREHGAVDLTTYYEPRVFNLEGFVVSSSAAVMWPIVDTLKQQFALNGTTHVLRWVREGVAYTERAIVSVSSPLSIDLPLAGRHCGFGVTLTAADPRIYRNTTDTTSFSVSGTATTAGNFNTAPTVTYTGAGTNPGLRNNALSTENEIRFAVTMVGGDVLIVDHDAKTITLNGTSRPDLLNLTNPSFFWKLAVGSNSLTTLGTSAGVSVVRRDAWI